MSKKKNNRNNKPLDDDYVDYEDEYEAWRARQEYLIPDEIENRIPAYFYTALAGELLALSGVWLFDAHEDDDSGEPRHDLNPGDGRWDLAFHAACDKLHMEWLYTYYYWLKPRQRNLFDGIIEARVARQLWPEDDEPFPYRGQDLYYRYLRGRYYSPV